MKKVEKKKKNSYQTKNEQAETLCDEGNAFLHKEEYQEALACYDRALALNPNYEDALANKGTTLGMLGDALEALKYYAKALAIAPLNTSILCQKGKLLESCNRNDEALVCFERAIEINFEYFYAYFWKGRVLDKLGQKENAQIYFKEVIKSKPKDLVGLEAKGHAFLYLQQYEEALTYFEKALLIKPNNSSVLSYKITALLHVGSYEEILSCCEQFLIFNPKNYNALNNKAIALSSLGRFLEAIDCYDQAINCESEPATPYSNKGLALESIGLYQQAFFCYEQALQLNPNNAIFFNNKGYVFISLNCYQEALACFEQGLAIQADQLNNLANKAFVLFCLESYEEAEDLANKVLDSTQKDKNAIAAQRTAKNVLGLLCFARDEIEEANNWFSEALCDVALERKQRILLGQVIGLRHLGAYDEALDCLDTILDSQTGCVPALFQKAHTYAMQEEWEAAIKTYLIALEHSPNNPDILDSLAIAQSKFSASASGASQHRLLKNNQSAIHVAAKKGLLDVLKRNVKPDNIDALDKNNQTMLMIAAQKGQLKVIQYLLDQGADIYVTNGDFHTAIDLAYSFQQWDALEILFADRPRLSLSYIENKLDECQAQYKGDIDSAGDDMILTDEYVSHLVNANVGIMRAKKETKFRHYVHLRSESDVVIKGKALEYWEIESFLPLRIRYLFGLLMKLNAGHFPEILLPGKNKAAIEQKLKYELWVTLETLRVRRDALMLAHVPTHKRKELREAHANYIARQITELKEGEEYCYGGGWKKHALYINFTAQQGNIKIRADNLGEKADQFHTAITVPQKKNKNLLNIKWYPYLLAVIPQQEFAEPSHRVIIYLKGIQRAKFKPAEKALALVYNTNLFVEKERKLNVQWPAKKGQEADNCVVYNHNHGLKIRFHERLIYRWYLEEEVKMCISKNPDRGRLSRRFTADKLIAPSDGGRSHKLSAIQQCGLFSSSEVDKEDRSASEKVFEKELERKAGKEKIEKREKREKEIGKKEKMAEDDKRCTLC